MTATLDGVAKKKIDDDRIRPRMEGRAVFAQAVRRFREVIRECLEANKISIDEVDHFLFHQANVRILDAVADSLNIPASKVPVNIHKYGNTSTASIPLALVEAIEEGRVKPGDVTGMVAFGSGLSWAGVVIRMGEAVAKATRAAETAGVAVPQ